MSYPVQSRSNRSDPDRSPRAQQPPLGRKRGFRTAARERTIAALRRLVARVEGQAFCLISPDGDAISFGKGEPSFTLRVHRPSGLDALSSLDALSVAHAYMEGDLDFEGNLLAAFRYQERFSDFHPAIYLWRRLQPMLVGRPHVNPKWIELHYDAENAQLHAADAIWHTYTPGVYSSDDEALELGADRKLALAFDALRLQADHSLLDVGCGWGGMLRYSAQRGVKVTGLTLSRLQKEYVDQKIAEERLPAKVHYQDFFTFDPTERFDAVSMMGVIEDLSDYRAVMRSLSRWLKPGGRVYLDFAAERRRFNTHSFVTLIKETFCDWQVILLTHEAFWFDIIKKELVPNGWLVKEVICDTDNGIQIEPSANDMIALIAAKRQKFDVSNDLRKLLEATLKEICCALEVKMAFRYNDQNERRMSGELLSELRATINRKCAELKGNEIFAHLEGSNLIATLGSHDNPEMITGGDVDVALGDIAKLKSLFACQRCGRNVEAKNVVPGQNKISCRCGKMEIEWK